jgi:arsenite methyltransferase
LPHWVSVPELVWLLDRNQFNINKIDVQENIFLLDNTDDTIDFSQSSSFGNFLGHLPQAIRESAIAEIKHEFEQFRTPEGIRLEGRRIIAIAERK